VPVVPSAKDGLHCGDVICREPARSRKVVPSAKDGLHCGRVGKGVLRRWDAVVPSAKDGLHCGFISATANCRDVKSSRPPRTGSIAALWAARTIAAAEARRPVRQGRAPLRPAHSEASGWYSQKVVPSAKDGLHCGLILSYSARAASACRPVRQGRAPLRHRGGPRVAVHRAGRPVRQGRAPLRHGGRSASAGRSRVVPSAKDGLHCGDCCAVALRSRNRSSRPPRTGSIAALASPDIAR